jgi:hypothetical protein
MKVSRHDFFISKLFKGGFFNFLFIYVRYSTLLHLPPLRSTVSEDAGIRLRTVASLALTVRRSNHSAKSHPHSARYLHTRLDLIPHS